MPVKELRSRSDLEAAFLEKTPLGFVVIYFYESGANTDKVLSPAYEDISRLANFSYFFKVSVDDLPLPDNNKEANEEDEADWLSTKFQVVTFPTFIVINSGKIVKKLEVSTREKLVDQLKRCKVLKEDAAI